MLEGRSSGKQTNDVDLKIELSARSDEDVGMEYLMLNLEVSGDSDIWDGNLNRDVLDRHRGRHDEEGCAEVGG